MPSTDGKLRMKGPRCKLEREQPTARRGAASDADRRAGARNDRRARAPGTGRQSAAQPQHGGVLPKVRTLKRFSLPPMGFSGSFRIRLRSMAASLCEGSHWSRIRSCKVAFPRANWRA